MADSKFVNKIRNLHALNSIQRHAGPFHKKDKNPNWKEEADEEIHEMASSSTSEERKEEIPNGRPKK